MMFVALVLLPAACLYQMGGWDGLSAALAGASSEAAAVPGLAATSGHLTEWFAGLSGLALLAFLGEDAGVGIGYLGQPHTCVRFMAIEDDRQLRVAFVISIVWAAVVLAGAVAVGLAAHGRFRLTPASAGSGDTRVYLADPEQVLPRLAMAILPEWLAGFVVSADPGRDHVVVGELPPVGRQLAEPGRLPPILPAGGGARSELLLVTRLLTGALGLVGAGAGADHRPVRQAVGRLLLVLYAWGGLSGCFSAPVVMALYYREMTRAGCIAGMVVGAVDDPGLAQHPRAGRGRLRGDPGRRCSRRPSIVLVSRLTRTQEASHMIRALRPAVTAAADPGRPPGAPSRGDEPVAIAPKYAVRVERNVRVPMRDGTTLSADLIRPDADGRFPADHRVHPVPQGRRHAWAATTRIATSPSAGSSASGSTCGGRGAPRASTPTNTCRSSSSTASTRWSGSPGSPGATARSACSGRPTAGSPASRWRCTGRRA